MKELEESIGHKPSSGSIYPLLNDMLKDNLVTLKKEDRKKIYCITAKGRTILKDVQKQKAELAKNVKTNMRMYENIYGKKEIKDIIDMMNKFEKGEEPLSWLTSELLELKMICIKFSKKEFSKENKEKIKKEINNMNSKLKRYM